MSNIVRQVLRGELVDTSRAAAARTERAQREQNRALDRIDRTTEQQRYMIHRQTEVHVERLHAAEYTTKRAMHGVAQISKVEEQLADFVPHATRRITTIAEIGTLTIAELVEQVREIL